MRRLPPWISISLVVAVAVLHGCDQPGTAKKNAGSTAPAALPPPPPPPVTIAPTQPPPPTVATTPPAANTTVATTPPATTEPADNTETVKAGVGVGIKGRSLDPHEGALVTPAKAFFAFREKAIFEIAIPQAMQFYKAENGAAPASHAEFMEKVVQANGIKLPELPKDATYQYNPQLEELQVVRQKKGG